MKLSIIDLSTVLPGETRHDALMHSIQMAKQVEQLGYHRIWFAEHHSAAFIAGRAPEVLIAAVAANTSKIKVGSGSVLLNHYSVFKVAEVFSTLNELYPGRIDLGAGRATTGPVTDYALQQDRSRQFQSDSNEQIAELVAWLDSSFPKDHPFAKLLYTIESKPEFHLLGSSSWSASAAAALGLSYVFAGFINQSGAAQIIDSYCTNFKPSNGATGVLKPEVILALHVVCADTEEEARRQLAPVHLMYKNLSMGKLDAAIPDPKGAIKELGRLPELEKYISGSSLPPKFIGGTLENVREQLENIAKDFSINEIMIQDMMTDYPARLHSYELMAKMID